MKYGLVAVFVSSMAEADVVPVLTGFVAHMGYFGLLKSIAVASAGAFSGDCVWFSVGRTRSEWIRSTRVYRRAREAVENLDRRMGTWLIPASHIIYGTRIATMTFSGIKNMSFARFAVADLLGCVVFTSLFATLGFLFSHSTSLIIGHIKRVELVLLLVAMVTAMVFHMIKVMTRRQMHSRDKDFKRA